MRSWKSLVALVALVALGLPIAAWAINVGTSGRLKVNVPLASCDSPPIFGGYTITHGDCEADVQLGNCYPLGGQCTCYGVVTSAEQPECADDTFGTGPGAPIWGVTGG